MKNIKDDFPIFKTYADLVYLDNGATTQKPVSVIEGISNYYKTLNANVHRGSYNLSELSTEIYEQSRGKVQEFINARFLTEIIFTAGTTDAINLVGYSWIWKNIFEGDTLLTTVMEHNSNIIQWQQAAKLKKNVNIEYVNITDTYKLDLKDLEQKLKKHQPKLFAVAHISNVLGTINPITKIVKIRDKVSPNTKILVDGAQAIGHIPVDVQELGVDFYAFSGHKMYGPMGIGVLWAKEEILENDMSPYRYGGGMVADVNKEDSDWADLPERFEGGTPNVAGAFGLGLAIDFITSIKWNDIVPAEEKLTKYLLAELSKIKALQVFGPNSSKDRIGVISFEIKGIHPHDIASILNEEGVAVRAGKHCAHILLNECLKTPAVTRVSLGIYNTKEDVDRLVLGIKKAIDVFARNEAI